jgi:hypothetical protein
MVRNSLQRPPKCNRSDARHGDPPHLQKRRISAAGRRRFDGNDSTGNAGFPRPDAREADAVNSKTVCERMKDNSLGGDARLL